MRLDKALCQSGERTRSEATRLVREGRVTVDSAVEKSGARKVDMQAQRVCLDGRPVTDAALQYVMLCKPAGVLTAARDHHAKTVMDLMPAALARRDVLPVGRLDKDTTGLLLLSNDGALAHALLSPKRHVEKEYLATVDGPLTEEDAEAFALGMALSDFTAKPARLVIEQTGEAQSVARVFLSEGKFHQVKRMFTSRGRTVTALRRLSFGSLRLDDALADGEFRFLTEEEIESLRQDAKGRTT
ncbi:MAG: rRNA pseudouridine synthase [Clostridia bacterium]|nr:rRNA pseudouridine synthase [Clostridia bacterium]